MMRVQFTPALALVTVLLLSDRVIAQIPALPGAAPPIAAPALPGAAAAAAPMAGQAAGAAKNIFSFICLTPEQKANCRKKLCNSPIGQLLNSMLTPAAAFSGGLIQPLCPPLAPNPDDLNKPADSALGAASKIKADEAQAKARREAVKYLGTVDCRYYPEAEAALINALRGDKNECVRMEAAKVLGSGCCCSAKVVAALTKALGPEPKDNFPPERSECVKALAYVALERCLRDCPESSPEEPPEKPGESPKVDTGVMVANFYARITTATPALYAEAREALARGLRLSQHTMFRLSGSRSVTGMIAPRFTAARAVRETPPPPLTLAAHDVPGPEEEPIVIVVAEGNEPPLAESSAIAAPPPPVATSGRRNLLNLFQDASRGGRR